MDVVFQRGTILGNSRVLAICRHGSEEIEFGLSWVAKVNSLPADLDVFKELNAFWATLDYSTQSAIFEVYRAIKNVFEEGQIRDIVRLILRLQPMVNDLCDLMPLPVIERWVIMHSGIVITDSFVDEFIPGESSVGTSDKTYTKLQYRDLIVMAIAIRAIVPIWGEFTHHNQIMAGKNAKLTWKEFTAFRLIDKTPLRHCAAMERLQTYLEANLVDKEKIRSAVIESISSEDFPVLILALVVYRRVSMGNIISSDPKSHLVSYIFGYVRNKMDNFGTSFAGVVRNKVVPGGNGGDDENKLSKLEGYRGQSSETAGDLAEIEVYISKVRRLIKNIAPNARRDTVKVVVAQFKEVMQYPITEGQVLLGQWLVARAVPAESLQAVNKEAVVWSLLASQVVLWERGHYELAAMITAEDCGNNLTDSTGTIPKDLRARIDELFPYNGRKGDKAKQKNDVVLAIEALAVELVSHRWRLSTGVQQLALQDDKVFNRNSRIYESPTNIKIQIANLVIQIAERSL